MSASEPDRINEVAPDLQGSTATAFDDIYLPGIGVRGALSDDAAESFDFRSNVGETCIRWAALVNNWAIQTVRSVRRIGSRLVVEVTNIGSQTAIKYRSKSPTQVTNWHTRYLAHVGGTSPTLSRPPLAGFEAQPAHWLYYHRGANPSLESGKKSNLGSCV